jgi:hypothetical protein
MSTYKGIPTFVQKQSNWCLRKHFKFRSHNKQLLQFERSEAPNKHISKQRISKWSYEYCAQFYLTFHDLDNSKQLDNAKTPSDAFMKIIPHNCLNTTDQTKAHLCSLLLSQPIPRAIQQVVRRMIQRWGSMGLPSCTDNSFTIFDWCQASPSHLSWRNMNEIK